MKVKMPYRCDYCGQEKGETNHWWLRTVLGTQFVLAPWSDQLADSPSIEHICSESCASKALSQWMAKVQAQAQAARDLDLA